MNSCSCPKRWLRLRTYIAVIRYCCTCSSSSSYIVMREAHLVSTKNKKTPDAAATGGGYYTVKQTITRAKNAGRWKRATTKNKTNQIAGWQHARPLSVLAGLCRAFDFSDKNLTKMPGLKKTKAHLHPNSHNLSPPRTHTVHYRCIICIYTTWRCWEHSRVRLHR